MKAVWPVSLSVSFHSGFPVMLLYQAVVHIGTICHKSGERKEEKNNKKQKNKNKIIKKLQNYIQTGRRLIRVKLPTMFI